MHNISILTDLPSDRHIYVGSIFVSESWWIVSVNSRAKGCRGERMFRDLCRKHGYTEVRRGQQYCGASGDADVIGLPCIHVEVKFVEKLNLRNAMDQSIRDKREGEIPIVAHKISRKPWLITMLADDWFTLYKFWNENKVGKKQ